MTKTSIEWTDVTWNPVRGCKKVSPGCKHCYAEAFARRFKGVAGHPYELGFEPRVVPHKLLEPFSWSEKRVVFVNSMSDLFQEAVPTDYIELVIEIMRACPWHVFQVLTKRDRRMSQLLNGRFRHGAEAANIWWGVSVENRKHGLPRIASLRAAPARVRFLSVEPLLEDLGDVDLTSIQWVIVGGESGVGARPMHPDWVRSIMHQCTKDNALFFFKQWGGVHKGRTGRLLDGQIYNDMPPRSALPVPDRAIRQALRREFQVKVDQLLAKLKLGETLVLPRARKERVNVR